MQAFFFMPIVIVFLVIVLPIWIIAHYGTRWRTNKTMTSGEEKLLADLWDTAGKMEERVRNLERILDQEAPDWRERL